MKNRKSSPLTQKKPSQSDTGKSSKLTIAAEAEVEASDDENVDPIQVLSGCALALGLTETAAGLVMGNEGLWPGGIAAWLPLLAALFTIRAVQSPTKLWRYPGRAGKVWWFPKLGAPQTTLVLSVVGMLLVAPWASACLAALAVLGRMHYAYGAARWTGSSTFALMHVGYLIFGMTVSSGALPIDPSPGVLALLLTYGLLAFTSAMLGHATSESECTPSGRPIDLMGLGSWILLAVPLLSLSDRTDMLARMTCLAIAVTGSFDHIRLKRRRRDWDTQAVGTATLASVRRLFTFCAAATVLSWTTTAVAVAALALLTSHLAKNGFYRGWQTLDTPGDANASDIATGIEQLEAARLDPESSPAASELGAEPVATVPQAAKPD